MKNDESKNGTHNKKQSAEEFQKKMNLIMGIVMGVIVLAIVLGLFMAQQKSSIPKTGGNVVEQSPGSTKLGAQNQKNVEKSPVQQKTSKVESNSQTNKVQEAKKVDLNKEKTEIVNIKTSKGDIKLALYPKLMPITVENFVGLVKKDFYNGLNFHRVENWVIQGGDPKGDGTGGSDKTIKLETNSNLKNIRGAVAMARSSNPDSASSQFYILKTDASWLDGNYAVFGKVISGMEVVDKIAIGDKMLEVKVEQQ